MEVDLGLADEAIRELEAKGFHLVKSGGPLGRENLTFQNDADSDCPTQNGRTDLPHKSSPAQFQYEIPMASEGRGK